MQKVAQKKQKRTRCRTLVPRVKLPPEAQLRNLSPEDRDLLLRATSEPIEYIDHDSFRKRSTEKELFGKDAELVTPQSTQFAPIPDLFGDVDEQVLETIPTTTLTPEQEQLLFRRFNYARYRVYRILKSYAGKRLSMKAVRELLGWYKRAAETRSQIVQANLPLVLAMAKRTKLTGVDFAELISEGNMALLRSVDKFDCSKGFKFSTYACRAILKSFSRVAIKTSRYRSRFPTEFDPALEKSDYLERKREEVERFCVEELRSILATNLANLNEVEQKVIRARFALDAPDPEQAQPMTLEQVGQIIGVTKERVRQIQNKALEKLRQALEETILAA